MMALGTISFFFYIEIFRSSTFYVCYAELFQWNKKYDEEILFEISFILSYRLHCLSFRNLNQKLRSATANCFDLIGDLSLISINQLYWIWRLLLQIPTCMPSYQGDYAVHKNWVTWKCGRAMIRQSILFLVHFWELPDYSIPEISQRN